MACVSMLIQSPSFKRWPEFIRSNFDRSSERKKILSIPAIFLHRRGWNGSFPTFLLVNVYQLGFLGTCWRICAGNQDKLVGGVD